MTIVTIVKRSAKRKSAKPSKEAKALTAVKVGRKPVSVARLEAIECYLFNFESFREKKRRADEAEAHDLQLRLEAEARRLEKDKARAERAAQKRAAARQDVVSPWDADTPAGRSQIISTAEWRTMISQALALNDVSPPSEKFSHQGYANILVTILEDRRNWRLFDTVREAAAYIAKEGEWAWSVLKDHEMAIAS